MTIIRRYSIITVIVIGLCNIATAQIKHFNMPIRDSSHCNIADKDIFDKYNNQHLYMYAADFNFITTRSTDTLSLYNIKTDSLMILFYDPDCSHCKKEIKKLRKDKHINSLIAQNKLTVLTIPPDITIDEWYERVKRMPENWINAFSLNNDLIIRKYLWKVPEMFILDRLKRIVYINMYKEDYDEG